MESDETREARSEEEKKYLANTTILFSKEDVSKTARTPNDDVDIDMDDYFNSLHENKPVVGKAIRKALGKVLDG